MANNRMYLTNRITGDKVLLAKYFPSGGWVPRDSADDSLAQRMRDCFLAADDFMTNPGGMAGLPLSSHGMYGGNDWFIEYEMTEEAEHARPTGNE